MVKPAERSYTAWRVLGMRSVRWGRLLTQQQLANKAHIGVRTIVRLENGQQSAQIGTLRKLSRALRCSIDRLLAE